MGRGVLLRARNALGVASLLFELAIYIPQRTYPNTQIVLPKLKDLGNVIRAI
jgi:hypothetical protein